MSYLYHATFREYVPDIQREGLMAGKHVSYQGSNPAGRVYFCYDEDCAVSFVEAADNITDDVYNSGIVLLVVDSSFLDASLYREDDNIQDEQLRHLNLAYEGVVPPSAIIEFRYI